MGEHNEIKWSIIIFVLTLKIDDSATNIYSADRSSGYENSTNIIRIIQFDSQIYFFNKQKNLFSALVSISSDQWKLFL